MQGQRTVYRLTLVKGFNTEELEQYAKLVELGDPDFIEVKVGSCSSWSESNVNGHISLGRDLLRRLGCQ